MNSKDPFSNVDINLDLPGIYFAEAWSQYKNGLKLYKKLTKSIRKHDNLAKLFNDLGKKNPKKADKMGTDVIWSLRELEILYEPVVKHFALSTILLVGTAEAYINEVAEVLLSSRMYNEFDKLSLLGKWIFLPKICKIKVKWDVGSEPIQSLSKLISIRNRLMHFKGRRKKLDIFLTPRFIEEMDLVPDTIKRSFETVQESIKQFNLAWKGGFGPYWLYVETREFRNPCFYLFDRKIGGVLYSGRIDKKK